MSVGCHCAVMAMPLLKRCGLLAALLEVSSESESANVSQTQHLKEGRVDTLALTGLRGFAALHLG